MMNNTEKVQKNLIAKAVEQGKATLIDNTEVGKVAKNVSGHGYAEIVENVPYKGGITK